jgi:hypothetical protein
MARALKQLAATGDVTTNVPARVHSVSLTAGSDAATLVVRDGAGTTVLLTVKAAANTTENVVFGDPVLFGSAIHGTLTGTGPVASFVYD